MEELLSDENSIVPRSKTTRKRKAKKKNKSSTNDGEVQCDNSRQPLGDVAVNHNQSTVQSECGETSYVWKSPHAVEGDDVDTLPQLSNTVKERLATASDSSDSSTTIISSDEATRNYYLYLKSIMTDELFTTLHKDVLSKAPPGTSVDTLEWLVTTYLQSDGTESPAVSQLPVSTKAPKRFRRTADREMIEAARFMSPPTPPDNAPVSRRRSRRIRKSLAVYREQGTLSSKATVKHQPDLALSDISAGETVTPSESEQSCTESGQSLAESGQLCSELERDSDGDVLHISPVNSFTQDLIAQSLPVVIEEDLLAPAAEMDSTICDDDSYQALDTTFVIEQIEDDDSYYVSPDIERLYKNMDYHAPSPKPLSTIFEEPHKNECMFSKVKRYRYFDFTEGCWYSVPYAKQNKRIKKAKKNGWRSPVQPNFDSTELLDDILNRLDSSMEEF